MKTETSAVNIDRSKGDFSYPEVHVRDAGAGLSERTVRYISDVKNDPDWVRKFRLRGLKTTAAGGQEACRSPGHSTNLLIVVPVGACR